MQDLAGKTAFVTGGASGIGLAIGRSLADAGANVVLADIETRELDKALAGFSGNRPNVIGVPCDVADDASVERAAEATIAAFGKVHILCNNAGVGAGGGADAVRLEAWRWVMDINLMGVVHGVKAFLPLIKAHGEGGHIVNTASMAGFLPGVGFSAYTASKCAVVGISEALAIELAPQGIGVSVLCPGWVNTRITESTRHWPGDLGPVPPFGPNARRIAELVKNGMDPGRVGILVRQAIENNQLYIFTHPEMREPLEERFGRVLAAYRQIDEAGS